MTASEERIAEEVRDFDKITGQQRKKSENNGMAWGGESL